MFVKAENPVAGSRNGYIDDADLQSLGATQTGTIAGHVKDESNDPLAGVVVSTDPTGYSGTTDSSGDYTISDVVVGTYDVTAYLAGYDPETDEDVTVTQGCADRRE